MTIIDILSMDSVSYSVGPARKNPPHDVLENVYAAIINKSYNQAMYTIKQ